MTDNIADNMLDKRWLYISIGSLLVTLLMGIILRLQYSGISLDFLANYDLRRAHSHLGFYGYLFPMIWSHLKPQGYWVPKGHWIWLYLGSVAFAIWGFLVGGYGPLSESFSLVVLIFWITFAIRNRDLSGYRNRTWLGSLSLSIGAAAFYILCIAGAAIAGSDDAPKLARGFVTVLAYGVFLPVVLESYFKVRFNAWIWVMGVVGFSLFMADLEQSFLFAWSPFLLAVIMTMSLSRGVSRESSFYVWRMRIYSCVLAVSLFMLAFNIIDNTHFIAVTGVHFLILMIFMTTYLEKMKWPIVLLYDFAAGVMTLSLLMLEYMPKYFILWQKLAAICGLFLFAVFFYYLLQVIKLKNWSS